MTGTETNDVSYKPSTIFQVIQSFIEVWPMCKLHNKKYWHCSVTLMDIVSCEVRKRTFVVWANVQAYWNQLAHLNRVYVIRKKKRCTVCYPKCAQWRFWSACANAQADLNLRWALIFEGTSPDVATPCCLFKTQDFVRLRASLVFNDNGTKQITLR